MRPYDQYLGGNDPFERDRTLWLRSLPAGARVTKATVTLKPKGGPSFQETFVLDTTVEPEPGELPGDKWGVTVTPPGPFVEIDFHARRTLAAVEGTNVTGANLQVDLGGVYAEINKRGAVKAPDDDQFELPADGTLPGLTVSKFKLSREAGTLDVTRVTIRSTPANVSVRLGEMPPFWTHLGDMVTAATSPDFADVLSAFLAEASAEDGFYAIPFVVHSDTIARLDVTLTIDYVIDQSVLPSYLPEVTLPYGYSSLPGVEEDLLTVELPRGATVAGTGGAVQGAFDATRVVCGEIGESGATARVTVSPGRTLAQPIRLADETPASGVDLPLGNTQPGLAGLHLALQADADGKPSGEVLTSAEVTVEKPAPGGSTWGSAALPAEFRFLEGERYWLVLQSVSGEAFWDVGPGDPAATPLQALTDGGLSWRTATTDLGEKPLAALFRLRHAPERFSVPVQLEVGEGPGAVRVSFDRFAPLGRVEFDLDFASELGEYLDSPAAASPCGSGNLLINGDFSDPPPQDDAARKLLGFDAKRVVGGANAQRATIVGTVDLSGGINVGYGAAIRIGVDDKDPVEITFSDDAACHWTLEGIVVAINTALAPLQLDEDVASHDGTRVILTSPSEGANSRIHLLVPEGTDATEDIFGITPPAHYQGADATSAQITGTANLSRGADLSEERFITLSVDSVLPVRIDCTGAIPARTEPDEIVTAINDAMIDRLKKEVAVYDSARNRLIITSPTVGAGGVVELHAWCRPQVPDRWQGVPGRVLRAREPETGRILVKLLAACPPARHKSLAVHALAPSQWKPQTCFAPDPATWQALTGEPAELAQRVAVVHGCTYLLQFAFQIEWLGEDISPLVLPRWEVEWLDTDGESLDTDGESFGPDDEALEFVKQSGWVEIPLTAPGGAVEADVRFVLPSPDWGACVLTLEKAKFSPTTLAIRNGNFGQWEGSVDDPTAVGWTHLGGVLDPELDEETEQVIGAKLQGGGPEDAVLVQMGEIVAEERYELRVQARPVGTLADDPGALPDQQRARLELYWLTDGDEIGAPVILPLDGRDFPTHAWAGIAPDRATQAEVRLIQPQGGGELLVESVSLSQVDLVSVPLTFLAEAPGELAVSDLRVAYEPPGPPPEPPPPRPAVQGAPRRQVAAAAPQPPTVRRMVEPAAPRPRSPLADRPIGIVAGVGDRFSDVLGSLPTPVTTVAELAALDPEAEVEGISRERRLELKTKAEMIAVITVEAAPFATLADEPLETLLVLPPAELARRTGQPAARAEQLQRDLRALRLVLKKDAFRSLRLSDLMPGG